MISLLEPGTVSLSRAPAPLDPRPSEGIHSDGLRQPFGADDAQEHGDFNENSSDRSHGTLSGNRAHAVRRCPLRPRRSRTASKAEFRTSTRQPAPSRSP